ncbi:MAG: prolipoprotein diacylglyceryl transferase [SAR324 cluster bacterium]|nr:prolipoprotein diacylglyceryl transferase [SAR324 cluster bacterium]
MLLTPIFTFETYRPYLFSIEIPVMNITLEPRFYGVFYAISILLGYRVLLSESRRRHLPLDEDQAMNCTLLIFLGGLLGGRAYEVIFEWSNHYAYQPWWEVFAIWHGGLAIHGGILGGTFAFFLYAKARNLRFLEMTDIGAMCIILGQAVGRWGNLTNGEAAGPVTDSPLGIVFPPGSPTYVYAQGQPVHPTMLYESLGNFIIFFILWKVRLRNFRPGMLLALHFILYSGFRMALTPLRMDNQYFSLFEGKILAPYATGGALIVTGILLIWKGQLWEQEPIPSIPNESAALASSSKKTRRSSRKHSQKK